MLGCGPLDQAFHKAQRRLPRGAVGLGVGLASCGGSHSQTREHLVKAAVTEAWLGQKEIQWIDSSVFVLNT